MPDVLHLQVDGPLHLEATVRALQRRPAHPVIRWEEGCLLRVLRISGALVLVAVRNAGSMDAPDLRAEIAAGRVDRAGREAVAGTLRGMLGLDRDVSAFEAAARAEPGLAPLARALHGMRPPRFPDLFESFANVIPFQQVSLDAGTAVVARLVERFGERLASGGRSWAAFPGAEAIAAAGPEALREVGLSRARAAALHHAASLIAAGTLRTEDLAALPSAEAMARLRQLPGIGPWSAALLLLRGLGRLDVFPTGDAGVARGLARVLGDEGPLDVEAYAARFGAQRGMLYFYTLGAQLLARGLVHSCP